MREKKKKRTKNKRKYSIKRKIERIRRSNNTPNIVVICILPASEVDHIVKFFFFRVSALSVRVRIDLTC